MTGSLVRRGALAVIGTLSLAACDRLRAQPAPPPPPVFSPSSGIFTRPFTLEISDSATNVISYTTDGTTPTVNSTRYFAPLAIGSGTTTVQAIAITISGATSTVTSATFNVAPSSSTTALTATPSPLLLPGSLQMSSVVNQTPAGGAMPTGSVNFYSDTSLLLGTADLTMLPGSQAWTNTDVQSAPIVNPVGLAAITLAKATQPVLVSASQTSQNSSVPTVALYQLSPAGTSLNAYTYYNANQSTTDAIASGYFLQAKSSVAQSFLVHEYGTYEVFNGSTNSKAGLALNPPIVTSSAGCDCNVTDAETIAVDDFDNDGYSDIGILIGGVSYTYNYTAVAGIALNAGTSSPGTFETFLPVPQPSGLTSPALFCPLAITTGHFTAAAGAELAVLATTPNENCGNSSGPGTIYLYALNGGNSALTQVGTPLALTDANATSLVAVDLNHDGKTDLVIGDTVLGQASTTGGISTAFGNGDGSFQTPSASVPLAAPPTQFSIDDFNADGYPDIAFTTAGGFVVMLNDGTGTIQNFKAQTFGYSSPITIVPGGIVSADLNGDGLPDLVTVEGNGSATANGNIEFLMNSASAQGALATASMTIPAGTHSLSAVYSGDSNFATSNSTGVPEVVNQTIPTITWPGSGTPLEYGTPLSTLQLNATASVPGAFVYSPAAQAVLPPGVDTLTATFTPTDTFDYASVMSTLVVNVAAPALASISPTSAAPGSGNTTITLTGQGFVNGAVASLNGTALASTYISQTQLTAVIPSSLLANPLSATVTVMDPGGIAANGSAAFSVIAAPPTATVSAAEATVTAGAQSTINLSVDPYPLAITAVATLTFTPAAPITVQDPAVLFSNNGTTESIAIAPSTTAATSQFAFQSGSTAGTITVTIHLTLSSGQDVTPASLTPVTVNVPAAPPVISSPTLTRSGQSMQISVIALSSTRDMTQAQFHFTPVSGKSLATTDVTVPLSTAFQGWYGSTASDQYGTNFMYTQPFTLNGDATDVMSVTITLTNSSGTSEPATAQ